MVTEMVDSPRQALRARFLMARAQTDALFGIVRPEAMYERPIPERHRIIFYIGHLEAFDRNLLAEADGSDNAQGEFDRLFAFGIDPVGGNLPDDTADDWPRLRIVNDYRDQTRREVDRLLDNPATNDEGDRTFIQKMNVAIEHRLMHAETLRYIFHQLPFESKVGQSERAARQRSPFVPESVPIPAGHATLGLRRDSPVFGWDNEFEQHFIAVRGFTVDKFKVTNGQYLKFMEDGGYRTRSIWGAADWEWRSAQDISHPVFWVRRGPAWHYRAMFGEIPLPEDCPVHVSHAEASAYARWAGKVLPTEAQWHRAAAGAFGVQGLIANGWEWTSTEFAPFPGFQAMSFYPGYSAPFFDGKHYVLKGGSEQTAPVMLRPSFRNWFQPHYQYVYAGFRCAERGQA